MISDSKFRIEYQEKSAFMKYTLINSYHLYRRFKAILNHNERKAALTEICGMRRGYHGYKKCFRAYSDFVAAKPGRN